MWLPALQFDFVAVSVAAFLGVAGEAAAQQELPCDDTTIEYIDASSDARCFSQTDGTLQFHLMRDSTGFNLTTIVIIAVDNPNDFSRFKSIENVVEAFGEVSDPEDIDWSGIHYTHTEMGEIRYREFSIDGADCFAFTNRWSATQLMVVWQCNLAFGEGNNITPAMVRELAASALIREE